MRKPLYIYGAGGLGREVLALIQVTEEWEPKGFIDDGVEAGRIINGLTVIGGLQKIQSIGEVNVIIALGNPLSKAKLVNKFPANVNFPVLIHPRATILDVASVSIGHGSIITAGVILTTDIQIGEHVLINLNATIGHDTTIGACSSIMPGVNISGQVRIGQSVLLGSGCNIRNRVVIGNRGQVGMGAVVLEELKEDDTVVGIPAKEIKK
jgi:sugar O-acyltransferase (sialic acid O-acetyltransferase NeuD family)